MSFTELNVRREGLLDHGADEGTSFEGESLTSFRKRWSEDRSDGAEWEGGSTMGQSWYYRQDIGSDAGPERSTIGDCW